MKSGQRNWQLEVWEEASGREKASTQWTSEATRAVYLCELRVLCVVCCGYACVQSKGGHTASKEMACCCNGCFFSLSPSHAEVTYAQADPRVSFICIKSKAAALASAVTGSESVCAELPVAVTGQYCPAAVADCTDLVVSHTKKK